MPRDDDAAASPTCSKPVAPVTASPRSRHLQTNSSFTQLRTPALPSSKHLYFPLQLTRSCNSISTSDKLLGLSSAHQDHIDILLVNQRLLKLRYRSSSVYNIRVRIFDRFQLRLRPEHTATSMSCTKHQDHPDLLDALSSRT